MPGTDHAAPEPAGLRRRVARGTLINGAFLVGINALNVARGLLVVGFLSATDYGVWGIVYVTLGLLLAVRAQGVTDRFVQQREEDQVLAFQRALSVELSFAAVLLAAGAVLAPAVALAYGDSTLLLPALVAALSIPGLALQVPIAIFYREMEYGRQRLLQSIDPVVATAVTLGLAAAGAGYWALVAGIVTGAWTGALVAVLASPYPLRWRPDREALRSYATFSWPLVLAAAGGAIMGQAILFTGEASLGLAGAGAITLSYTITQYANRLDQAISATIYPAICAAVDRTEVLFETFVKSNRLAVLWGAFFGVGLALFADDFVTRLLGDSWRPAIPLLQATGVMAAIHQVAFNWDIFYRARADTRPIAVATGIGMAAFFLICLPSLALWGLEGLAVGFLVFESVGLVVRLFYTRRIFPDLRVTRHATRGFAPALLGGALVLAVRAAEPAGERGWAALGELTGYVLVTVGATLFLERALLREMAGYLRRRRAPSTVATPVPTA